MHFLAFTTLALSAVALAGIETPAEIQATGSIAATGCSVGYNYCGWYLADNLGELDLGKHLETCTISC